MKCPYCMSHIVETGSSSHRCPRCEIVWSLVDGRLEEADLMHSSRWLWLLPAVSAFALLIFAVQDTRSVATGVTMLATGSSMLLIAWRHGVVFVHSGIEAHAHSPVTFWLGIALYGLLATVGAVSLLMSFT
jgi:hypothetical protein